MTHFSRVYFHPVSERCASINFQRKEKQQIKFLQTKLCILVKDTFLNTLSYHETEMFAMKQFYYGYLGLRRQKGLKPRLSMHRARYNEISRGPCIAGKIATASRSKMRLEIPAQSPVRALIRQWRERGERESESEVETGIRRGSRATVRIDHFPPRIAVTRAFIPRSPSAVSVIARTGAIRHARLGSRRTTCEIVTLFRRKSCPGQSHASARGTRRAPLILMQPA